MSNIEFSSDLIDALKQVSELVASDEGQTATLQRIVDVSAQTVPGCDAAGITLIEDDGSFTTPVSTDPFATQLDGLQYSNDEGPCVDSARDDGFYEIIDIDSETRWPQFAPDARECGLKSSMSFPLGGLGGALNLYARTPDAFSDADRTLGRLLAAQATVAIQNALLYLAARDLSDGLNKALESRDVIGQAKGILMEREGVDSDTAFQMLTRLSQHTNVKLREVAQRIVSEADK